jgi:hypothetical protein
MLESFRAAPRRRRAAGLPSQDKRSPRGSGICVQPIQAHFVPLYLKAAKSPSIVARPIWHTQCIFPVERSSRKAVRLFHQFKACDAVSAR